MQESRRYRLVIAYLGGPFRGWQRQENEPTVQGTIEEALGRIFNQDGICVVGSGRTDAGVHAAGQVAHADLPAAIPPEGLLKALNATLPETVRIRSASIASPNFHARRSARAKRYLYRIRWDGAPILPPWHTLRSASIRPVEDPKRLANLVSLFEGRRDWAAFTVPDPETPTTVRSIFRATAVVRPHELSVQFLGEGFLRYQVRRMIGALLQVGWGRRTPEELNRLLQSRRHEPGLFTAPACGLTLERVFYRSPLRGND